MSVLELDPEEIAECTTKIVAAFVAVFIAYRAITEVKKKLAGE